MGYSPETPGVMYNDQFYKHKSTGPGPVNAMVSPFQMMMQEDQGFADMINSGDYQWQARPENLQNPNQIKGSSSYLPYKASIVPAGGFAQGGRVGGKSTSRYEMLNSDDPWYKFW